MPSHNSPINASELPSNGLFQNSYSAQVPTNQSHTATSIGQISNGTTVIIPHPSSTAANTGNGGFVTMGSNQMIF